MNEVALAHRKINPAMMRTAIAFADFRVTWCRSGFNEARRKGKGRAVLSSRFADIQAAEAARARLDWDQP